MKKNYFLVLLLCFGFTLTNAQTYVKVDASGANNGSSWVDAYTDLTIALTNTTSGEIWVANGTYMPGSGAATVDSRFAIMNNVNLIGGFSGTETNASMRDPNNFNTNLVGDINQDDITGDFTTNRSDNVHHVLYIDSLVNNTTIDGFNISGGNTLPSATDADIYTFGGGGLFSYGGVTLLNTNFQDNYGSTGGACLIIGGSSTFIKKVNVTGNYCDGSGIIQLRGGTNITVDSCSFNDNTVTRGALYPLSCDGINITNSSFNGNNNPLDYGGAAMFIWNCLNLVLDNCSFTNNNAARGAAFYMDGRNLEPNVITNTISNCTFEDNTTSNIGGAILLYIMSVNIENNVFNNNSSLSSGGAIIAFGDNRTTNLTGNTFSNNSGSFGGAVNFQSTGDITFMNNTFIGNSAETSGGAGIMAFKPNVVFTGNTFENNTASFGAGLYIQSDSTTLDCVENLFQGNVAENTGGGLFVSSGSSFQITDNNFSANTADVGGGVAISVGADDVAGENALVARNEFSLNSAGQGSAINLNALTTDVRDCLFAGNNASGTGTGTISINAGDTITMEAMITNCTFAENVGALAQGVAAWTGESEAFLTTYFQNNIFANDDAINYAIEGGTPIAVSNGGNLSNDASMDAFLTHPKDLSGNGMDPLFVDTNNENYNLMQSSPGVNGGVNNNISPTDLVGNPRIDSVDMGALESPFLVAIKEILINGSKDVKLTPNPAVESVQFTLDNDWSGDFSIAIYTIDGKLVHTINTHKSQGLHKEQLNIGFLEKGIYKLLISNKKELYKSTLIKR